jgi:hypothetical protein
MRSMFDVGTPGKTAMSRFWRGLILAGVIGTPAGAALGQQQIQPVEPYWAVVTADNSPLKCRDGSPYYAVAMLNTGAVVRVDGSNSWWVRCEYPKGTKAFVKVEEATASADAKQVTLNAPSRLMAANVNGGERGNWWQLLDTEMPAGSKFEVSQALKTPDGKVYGYLITPPPQARGYLRSEQVRKATQPEIDAHLKALGGTAPPITPVETRPKPGEPTTTTPPTTPPGATPPGATPPGATPTGAAPAPEQGGNTPVSPPVEPAKPRELTVIEKRWSEADALRAVFERVQAQPLTDAEFGPAIAEFNKVIGELDASPEQTRIKDFLQQRLGVLQMREQLQKSSREAQQKTAQFGAGEKKLAADIAAIQQQRRYAAVGKLTASTVYDGVTLPKMFRVVSLDGFGRTVGYVAPTPDFEVESRLGMVVGIVGESRFDEALRLNIIKPERIDALTVRPGGTIEAAPATPATTPPATDRGTKPAPAGPAPSPARGDTGSGGPK